MWTLCKIYINVLRHEPFYLFAYSWFPPVWCKSMSLTKDECVASLFIVFLNNLFSFCRDQAIVYQRINSFGITMYMYARSFVFRSVYASCATESIHYINTNTFFVDTATFWNPNFIWHVWNVTQVIFAYSTIHVTSLRINLFEPYSNVILGNCSFILKHPND